MSSAHDSLTGSPELYLRRAHSGSSAVTVVSDDPWKPGLLTSYLTGTAATGRRSTRRGGAAGEYSPAFPSCTTAGACSAAEAEAAAGRLRARLPQPGAEEGCPQAERVGGRLKAMALHKG